MPLFPPASTTIITMTPTSVGSPSDGNVWYDSTQDAMTANIDGITQRLVGCIFTSSSTKTITNTTTPTSGVPSGVGTMTLPANFWAIGKSLRLTGRGVFSTAVAAPGSFTCAIKHGSVTLATSTVSAIVANLSTQGFTFETLLHCTATGTSGNIYAAGSFSYSTGLNLSRNFVDLDNNGAGVTINTTTAQLLDVVCTWGTASTSNILLTTNVIAEVCN